MNFPLVSVIMPVYNSEKYLKEAIDSILSQSYKNIELVIVNDGSTDSSKAIILRYSDSRIFLIENESNSGIVYSRNRGLEMASGEYVATLDSDDIALPERIEKQVGFLESNLVYGMCGTYYISIDSNGAIREKIKFPTENRDIVTYLTLGNCFCNSTVMVRSKIAKELKYREKFDIVEDYELWYRISKQAKLFNLQFYGTLYRVHGTNISVAKQGDMLTRAKKINAEILHDLGIDFSEFELEIHANLLNRNIDYFRVNIHFVELEKWIVKFYLTLRNNNRYNHFLLYKLIADKWIAIAFNIKNYNKLVMNRFFELNKTVYLSRLSKKIIGKIRITN
jgi:glycosyltransferase involved in cell wall biosynthesis